jgi:hypothetical protein
VRHFPEPHGLAQLGPLGEQRHHAAVVGPEELLEREQGEQLRLRVVLPAVPARVCRQPRATDAQRLARHRDGRLRHGPTDRLHATTSGADPTRPAAAAPLRRISTEHVQHNLPENVMPGDWPAGLRWQRYFIDTVAHPRQRSTKIFEHAEPTIRSERCLETFGVTSALYERLQMILQGH